MIKKRTQLIYQFGMAILFAVVGAIAIAASMKKSN